MPDSTAPVIVIGAGQAGLQICDSLRRSGYAGALLLLGDEPVLPYQRPPLSKKFLTGDFDAERLLFRPQNYYEKIGVEVRLGAPVTAIDRQRRSVTVAGGETLAYHKLALATGTRVRPLSCAGADLADIFYVRTVADATRLKQQLAQAERVAVIGGGFIGLEVAGVARELGKSVVVIEALERLLARAVSPQVSEFYAGLHQQHGVILCLHAGVREIRREGGALILETNAGALHGVDLIVAGIGVIPNSELALSCGLACRNGIVVDEFARTSDPDIVAAGDCTMHFNGFLGREIRLESVQNAVDQAKVAAATLQGASLSYRQVPWFWSDQYDIKLQIAGICTPYDETVVRGDIAAAAFSVFYFRAGQLIGADSINRPADHMACRKLLAQGTMLSLAQARDSRFDLMQLARG